MPGYSASTETGELGGREGGGGGEALLAPVHN